MDESSIPIDINIGKLLDWLISRRHISKDWLKNINSIREKINNALKDMPAHEDIATLLSGNYINYFHCKKIIEILKETEKNTKNLFGVYGSQRMKDWQDIIKSYEKENNYLAEWAQMLVRNINYEIPGLRKQISKEEQLQIEFQKKQADNLKNESSCKSEFSTLCKQLGIDGLDIKKELIERIKELPEIYDKISESLKPVLPAIELYEAFTNYMFGDKNAEVLTLLRFIVQHGNTTVYEWSYGEPPNSIEPDSIDIIIENEETPGEQIDVASEQIDFGSFEAAAGDIDFGDGDAGNEIDWGNLDLPGDQPAHLHSGAGEILLEESGIVVEEQGEAGGVARGTDALSLLDNPETRSQIVNQLVELESFLKMRLYETNTSGDGAFSYIDRLPSHSCAALTAMLDGVQVAASRLTAADVMHLHNVKHSPRYVDMLSEQLRQKRALCGKLGAAAARAGLLASSAADRACEARPVLTRLVEATRDLQKHIEKDISNKYKGRPVHIIGGINFL